MTQDVEKSHERGKGNPLSLSIKDRTDGFSVMTDDGNNITLLRWSKPIAWFSAALSEEAVKVFIRLIKACE